jgi:hypothetical protein
MWRLLRSTAAEPLQRRYFEVYGRALQEPESFPGFLEHAVSGSLAALHDGLVDAGFAAHDAPARATLLLAAYRGLLLDLLATGDHDRVDRAHRHLRDDLAVRLRRDGRALTS